MAYTTAKIYIHVIHVIHMANLVIRNVNKKLFAEFKSQATREGLTVGKAMNRAMSLWVGREKRKPTKSILDLKPVKFGDKKASKDVDEDLYGG